MQAITTSCPICEKTGNSKVVYDANIDQETFSIEVFSARRLPDRKHYQWVRCNTCSLLRSDPILDIDLERLYVESTFDYSSEVGGLKRTYIDITKKVSRGLKVDSILEIGGGNGFFLEEALDNGFKKVCGVEPSTEAIAAARADVKPHMIASLMKSGIVADNTFDVGAMFHTLDHLPDPVTTLRDAFNALKPGGVFVVAVHNERSWSARLLGEKSPIIDVEHTHLYSKKTGRLVFEKAGFENVKAGAYWNHYSLAYILHLIPISRTFRRKILDSAIGTILSKIKVIVPLGNMWVSGQKPKA